MMTSRVQGSDPVVADAMSVDPISVDSRRRSKEADRLLRSTYITGIPVVDRDGVLVGVISHAHLIAYRFTEVTFSKDPGGIRPET